MKKKKYLLFFFIQPLFVILTDITLTMFILKYFIVHSYNKQQNENLQLNNYHVCHGQQVLGKKSKQAESECPLQQDVTEVTIEVRTL